jgi:hypothetical protein
MIIHRQGKVNWLCKRSDVCLKKLSLYIYTLTLLVFMFRILLVILLLLPCMLPAQNWQTAVPKGAMLRDTLFEHEFNIAPQIGTDIGGAVPVPFGAEGRTINAYPRLAPSIGLIMSYTYQYRWNVAVELNYKRISMDADARVTNQLFKGEDALQYFTGTAKMHMSFTMLEVPVYAKYMLGRQRQHGLILGGYFAYNLEANFVTTALKGYTGPMADVLESTITEPMIMDFTPMLDTWDAGVLLGYQSRIFSRVNMGFRVLVGFKEIFLPDSDFFDYKMFPMRGSISLGYDLIRFGKVKNYVKKGKKLKNSL